MRSSSFPLLAEARAQFGPCAAFCRAKWPTRPRQAATKSASWALSRTSPPSSSPSHSLPSVPPLATVSAHLPTRALVSPHAHPRFFVYPSTPGHTLSPDSALARRLLSRSFPLTCNAPFSAISHRTKRSVVKSGLPNSLRIKRFTRQKREEAVEEYQGGRGTGEGKRVEELHGNHRVG